MIESMLTKDRIPSDWESEREIPETLLSLDLHYPIRKGMKVDSYLEVSSKQW